MENSTESNSTTSTALKDLTFAYYIISLMLQFLAFSVGTLYVLRRDYRYREEERLQEWRKFSEELSLKYIDMIRDKVIQRLQHANESLKVLISPHVNGLHVLRYMVNDEDRFPNAIEDERSGFPGVEKTFKPTVLGKLRHDLRSVFVLLNYCWSLCLLGKIPEDINREMERIVIVLGKLVFPFYSEESDERHRFTIIKGCLEKFGVTPTELTQMNDLTIKLPYVQFLQYEPNMKTGKIITFETRAFSRGESFLCSLHFDLVESENAADYALRFAEKMKETKDEWIGEDATDEVMVLKLIHDVRCITWKTVKNLPINAEDEDLLGTLTDMRERRTVPVFFIEQETAKAIIDRFKEDLELQFENYGYKDFKILKTILSQLQDDLKQSNIPEFANDELPSFRVRVFSSTVWSPTSTIESQPTPSNAYGREGMQNSTVLKTNSIIFEVVFNKGLQIPEFANIE